ncbi:MAG: hypothetical protein WC544_04730 [Patescibacteria group bacterium]
MATYDCTVTLQQINRIIDEKLSSRSYLSAPGGKITVTLRFKNARSIMTPDVCRAITRRLVADGYTDASITFIGNRHVLTLQSPIH